METLARIHWMGKKKIAADTNSFVFASFWKMPESVQLEAQTLDKLASAPWRLLRGQTNVAATNLLRPLLQDLVEGEWYLQVRRPADSVDTEQPTTNAPGQGSSSIPGDSTVPATNASEEMILAIRLDSERARLWQANLAMTMESLTGIGVAATREGWSLKKHHAPNLIQFTRAGGWVVLGAAEDHNALLDEVVAHIKNERAPFAEPATNAWLEAEIDLPRVVELLGARIGDSRSSSLRSNLVAKLPKISLAASGKEGLVHTAGDLVFAGLEPAKLEAWNIPTNLIDANLTSFTAVRGLQSWLGVSELWSNLQAGSPPDQLYIWALHSFPMGTYFAAPTKDASNTVSRLSDLVLQKGKQWSSTNHLVAFRRSPTFNGISWRGAPYTEPFLRSMETNGESWILGGCFSYDSPIHPPPSELFKEIVSRTNLVCYDWEVTGARIEQLIYLTQFARFVAHKAELSGHSVGLEWLRAAVRRLGNCATEVSQTGPGRFSFARSSGNGLTALEMNLMADWLESPDFPRGLHTILVPPTNLPDADFKDSNGRGEKTN